MKLPDNLPQSTLSCPRCGYPHTQTFYGPCVACRAILVTAFNEWEETRRRFMTVNPKCKPSTRHV